MYGMANMEWLNDRLDEKNMYLYFLLRKNIHPQIFPDFLFFLMTSLKSYHRECNTGTCICCIFLSKLGDGGGGGQIFFAK